MSVFHHGAHVARVNGERTVADVMRTGVVTTYPDAPVKEIAADMARNRVSTIPVISATGEVVGVITSSDLIGRIGGDRRAHRRWGVSRRRRRAASTTARSVMTWPPVTVTAETTIAEAAELARVKHVRFMPVVNDAVLVGCVSTSDLTTVYLRDDSEILDEVRNHAMKELMLVEPSRFAVSVTGGVVDVTGMVETRDQAEQLVECIRAVSGVIDVRDHFSFIAEPRSD